MLYSILDVIQLLPVLMHKLPIAVQAYIAIQVIQRIQVIQVIQVIQTSLKTHPVANMSEEVHETSELNRGASQEMLESGGSRRSYWHRSSYLYRWEAGKSTPRGYNLRKLCEVYGMTNELETAESVLLGFLPKILNTSQGDEKVAHLASYGLRLQSILVHHRLKISDKVGLCEQSVNYARCSNNPDTLVAALLELAAAYKYNNLMDKWFSTLQEALHASVDATPLNQAHAYSYIATAFATHKRYREAEMYMQMAFEVFPNNPAADIDYAIADSSIFTLSYHAGKVRLAMNQVANAYVAFESYKRHPAGSSIPDRLRLEIVNAQSKAAIQENDLEKYVHFLDSAIVGAVSLGSRKRFDEAHKLFQQEMPDVWLTHPQIRSIAEQYHLERKS
jgi:tetratricopeptide (TPR) repeat protein